MYTFTVNSRFANFSAQPSWYLTNSWSSLPPHMLAIILATTVGSWSGHWRYLPHRPLLSDEVLAIYNFPCGLLKFREDDLAVECNRVLYLGYQNGTSPIQRQRTKTLSSSGMSVGGFLARMSMTIDAKAHVADVQGP